MTPTKAEQHFDAVDLSKFSPGGDLHITTKDIATAEPAIITKICGIYQTIRPYLQLAANFFLLPAKVRNVLNVAMTELDKLCPAS